MSCPICGCIARARQADQQRVVDLILASGLTIGGQLDKLPETGSSRGRRRAGEIGGKRCSNCFSWKPVSAFCRKLNGYQSRCRDCNAEGGFVPARQQGSERIVTGRHR